MPNDLPEGFTLDQTSSDLPEGFTLDQEKPYNGTGTTPWSPSDPNSLHAKLNKYLMDNHPDLIHTLNSGVKGLPVVGAAVGDTPGQADFEKDNPTQAGAANLVGSVAGYAPMAAATAAASGPGLLMNALTQAGLGSTVGALDSKAHGDTDEQAKNKALLGALGGATGPVVGKVLSPGINLSDGMAKAVTVGGGTLGGIYSAMHGGLTHELGPILGLLLGEQPAAVQGVQRAASNTVMRGPKVTALLSALGSKGGSALSSGPLVPNGD